MRLAVFVPFVLFPLAMRLGGLAGLDLPRNGIDLLWAALGLRALLHGLHGGAWPRAGQAALAAAGLAVLWRFAPPWLAPVQWTAWAMELKPLFYLAVAWLLAVAGLAADRRDLRRGADALAVLLLADFAISSLWAGEITRPEGSGEVNYDACLLLLPLALEPLLGWRQGFWALAVAASFSRTGLVSLGFVLAARARRPWAAAGALLLAGCGVWVSFAVRGLAGDELEALDRYWMWLAGVRLFQASPLALLTGFAPGAPLPVEIPPALQALWDSQARAWGLDGVFAFNLHAFWLRLAVTWGLPLAGAAAWACLRLGRSPAGRGLALVLLVQGLTMGLFYLGNVAVPLWMAVWLLPGPCLACCPAAAGCPGPPGGPGGDPQAGTTANQMRKHP